MEIPPFLFDFFGYRSLFIFICFFLESMLYLFYADNYIEKRSCKFDFSDERKKKLRLLFSLFVLYINSQTSLMSVKNEMNVIFNCSIEMRL